MLNQYYKGDDIKDRSVYEPQSVDKLPDDPFKMPPPYWRGSGAIFHILDALEELLNLLKKLIPTLQDTESKLDKHFEHYPDGEQSEEEMEEFSEITSKLFHLEHSIKLKVEIAILMSAIALEDQLNMVIVFNLQKDIAESIRKLPPSDKLVTISNLLDYHDIKKERFYPLIQKLYSWRNAFAHGHCIDRTRKSLRHNHLIKPTEYPGVLSSIKALKEFGNAFVLCSEYLRTISKNPYCKGSAVEVDEIMEYLREISRYSFKGNNDVYDVTVSD